MTCVLLILTCSDRKLENKNLLPALERYDGPNYRVIKKLQRDKKFPKNLEIVIVSAKYGFLQSNDMIDYYNQRMTRQRATEINSIVLRDIQNSLKSKEYKEIFINMGKDYLPAIEGFEKSIPQDAKIIYAKGRIGQKMGQMKRWLLKQYSNENNK